MKIFLLGKVCIYINILVEQNDTTADKSLQIITEG